MGYMTYYNLEIAVGDSTKTEFHQDEISKIYNDGYSLWDQDWKWYEHDEHMLDYSLKYPSTVFALHGDGEETGDNWVTFYRNGQSYTESKHKDVSYDDNRMSRNPDGSTASQFIILNIENMSLVINGKSKQTAIFASEDDAKQKAKKLLIKDYQIIKLEL